MSENPARSVDGRPAREQVYAALGAEPCPADREDWETLVDEVLGLRAELSRSTALSEVERLRGRLTRLDATRVSVSTETGCACTIPTSALAAELSPPCPQHGPIQWPTVPDGSVTLDELSQPDPSLALVTDREAALARMVGAAARWPEGSDAYVVPVPLGWLRALSVPAGEAE